jgi:hypothetical protein
MSSQHVESILIEPVFVVAHGVTDICPGDDVFQDVLVL